MKKFILSISILFFLLSCEKDYLIPDKDVPGWLKEKIIYDENAIKETPKISLNYGCWIRYNWNGVFYFEYHNVLSSSLASPKSFDGEELIFTYMDANTDYYKEKCCKQYVWKAPKYNELADVKK
jgi:hypothetical protein